MPVGSKSFKLFPRGGFPEACEALGYGGVGWDVKVISKLPFTAAWERNNSANMKIVGSM